MNIAPLLQQRLEQVAKRQRRLELWSKLALAWLLTAVCGLFLVLLERIIGWGSSLAEPLLILFGLLAFTIVVLRNRRSPVDLRALALAVEKNQPTLEGRLLTAIQQQPKAGAELGYLQERLLRETLEKTTDADWIAAIPRSRLAIAQTAHWLALLLFGLVVASLHIPGSPALLSKLNDSSIIVTPGDTNLESGSSLIVLARFTGPLPPKVELAVGASSNAVTRIPLARSLANPIFGGSVPEVSSNLVYHIEYSGGRTRDFKVTVFEFPRLERADADLTFPEYTRQAPKRIEDTRRLTAVQGSRLVLTLQLNKPVASARLLMKNQPAVPFQVETNRALAALKEFPLEKSSRYELELVDAEGRTNKAPAQFVFEVLSNRPPELRLTSPRGDLRPSALEEISFDGTVWDDFGVEAYGLGYTVAGQEPKFIELGKQVPAKEKRPFHYLLRLEDLRMQPEQLLAWFVWADDAGPDGKIRRTAGDMYFGEVRPFEEVFRESQGMESQGEGQPHEENQADKLAGMQKQIINATWKLQRTHSVAPGSTAPNSGANKAGSGGASALQIPNSTLASRQVRGGWLLYSLVHHQVLGQAAARSETPVPRGTNDSSIQPGRPQSGGYHEDTTVVRDAQAQALEQANTAAHRQDDPRGAALWETAAKEMERALSRLNRATNSPSSLPDALAAEEAAYQALIKLQAHEYQVSRSRSRSQNGSSRNQQMQRQLDQMDLTQPEDRYETQRQAKNQPGERREQLQVMNRLQELARRQQDLNARLKELQTSLQEARTEQERQEIQRRLKRLQEEEQQMLADVDELRQRMDQPENQSRMSDERRQLDQTRNEIQRASEAAAQGEASQALAAGTRAQRQLQDLREQMRKENSSQFAEDLREMRAQARELERRQEEIQKKMTSESGQKSLSDSSDQKAALEQLAQQKQRMTNLVERATQVSQQADEAEPLLSRQLYDTVRKFTQDNAKSVKELQDELLSQRQLTRGLYDRLHDPAEPEASKLLDATSELLRQDALPQAQAAGERARTGIAELKRGVERAAQSVIGDDTEALRLAQRELDQLTDQLKNEIAQAEGGERATNQVAGLSPAAQNGQAANSQRTQPSQRTQGQQAGQPADPSQGGAQGQPNAEQAAATSPTGERPGQSADPAAQPANQANQSGQQANQAGQPANQAGQQANQGGQRGQRGQQANQQNGQAGQQPAQPSQSNEQASQPGTPSGQPGNGQQPGENQDNVSGQENQAAPQTAQAGRGGRNPQNGPPRQAQRGELNPASNPAQANGGGGTPGDWNRLLDANTALNAGPLTGNEFGPWSDRLRDVEEMVELPDLRNEVAVVRDRARVVRQDFRREHKKPDWAVVRSQIMKPLVEVRDQIADELARRQSNEALVPIDRDPVPTRFSDLVRRYYENLGKDK